MSYLVLNLHGSTQGQLPAGKSTEPTSCDAMVVTVTRLKPCDFAAGNRLWVDPRRFWTGYGFVLLTCDSCMCTLFICSTAQIRPPRHRRSVSGCEQCLLWHCTNDLLMNAGEELAVMINNALHGLACHLLDG